MDVECIQWMNQLCSCKKERLSFLYDELEMNRNKLAHLGNLVIQYMDEIECLEKDVTAICDLTRKMEGGNVVHDSV